MGSEIYKRNTVNEPAILVENISKYFGSKKILSNINFIVNTGEIFSLIGPNGAGKTTMIRIILGLLTPSSGQVRVFDANSFNSKNFLKNVSAVLEKDVLWEKFTGIENLLIAMHIWGLNTKLFMKSANEYAELLKLNNALKQPVYAFSKGMKRKLSIIMSLIRNPDLLILDEPNSGIDPEARIDIRNMLLLLKNNGKTVFVTSHDLEEIQKLSDQIAIINKGKIVFLNKIQYIRNTGVVEIIAGIGEKSNFSELIPFLKENKISFKRKEDLLIAEVMNGDEIIQKITKEIIEKGYKLKGVKDREESLESMYMKIIQEEEEQ